MERSLQENQCPQCGLELAPTKDQRQMAFCPDCRFPQMRIAGKYRLLEACSEGGFGQIYRAQHIHMQEAPARAIKVLKPRLLQDQAAMLRFTRELQLTALLSQQNQHIVRVYDDFGEIPRLGHYYVMEYLRGASLADVLRGHELPPLAACIDLLLQLCDAMKTAHDADVLHRDLKPANLFLHQQGDGWLLKLLDFGVAKGLRERWHSLTQAEGAVGTPAYMSPEQCLGQPLDARSDIYAMGILFYELLTGQTPFEALLGLRGEAPTAQALLAAQVHHKAPRLAAICPPSRQLPDGLQPFLDRALAKAPEQRFRSAEAFADALRALCDEEGIQPARWQLSQEELLAASQRRAGPPLSTPDEPQDATSAAPASPLIHTQTMDGAVDASGPHAIEKVHGSPSPQESHKSPPEVGPPSPAQVPSAAPVNSQVIQPPTHRWRSRLQVVFFVLLGALGLWGGEHLWGAWSQPEQGPRQRLRQPVASSQPPPTLRQAALPPRAKTRQTNSPSLPRRRPLQPSPPRSRAPHLRKPATQKLRARRKPLRPTRRSRVLRPRPRSRWSRIVPSCPRKSFFWVRLRGGAWKRGFRLRLKGKGVIIHRRGSVCVGVTAPMASLRISHPQGGFVPCELKPAQLPTVITIKMRPEGGLEPESLAYCAQPGGS